MEARALFQFNSVPASDFMFAWRTATRITDVSPKRSYDVRILYTSKMSLKVSKNQRVETASPARLTTIHSKIEEHSTYSPDPSVLKSINTVLYRSKLDGLHQMQKDVHLTEKEDKWL